MRNMTPMFFELFLHTNLPPDLRGWTFIILTNQQLKRSNGFNTTPKSLWLLSELHVHDHDKHRVIQHWYMNTCVYRRMYKGPQFMYVSNHWLETHLSFLTFPQQVQLFSLHLYHLSTMWIFCFIDWYMKKKCQYIHTRSNKTQLHVAVELHVISLVLRYLAVNSDLYVKNTLFKLERKWQKSCAVKMIKIFQSAS